MTVSGRSPASPAEQHAKLVTAPSSRACANRPEARASSIVSSTRAGAIGWPTPKSSVRRFVFSRYTFLPEWLGGAETSILTPGIDPGSTPS